MCEMKRGISNLIIKFLLIHNYNFFCGIKSLFSQEAPGIPAFPPSPSIPFSHAPQIPSRRDVPTVGLRLCLYWNLWQDKPGAEANFTLWVGMSPQSRCARLSLSLFSCLRVVVFVALYYNRAFPHLLSLSLDVRCTHATEPCCVSLSPSSIFYLDNKVIFQTINDRFVWHNFEWFSIFCDVVTWWLRTECFSKFESLFYIFIYLV